MKHCPLKEITAAIIWGSIANASVPICTKENCGFYNETDQACGLRLVK